MNDRLKLVIASIAGAFIIHFLSVACSDRIRSGGDEGDAQAQETGACSHWEVQAVQVANQFLNDSHAYEPREVPTGWEPYATSSDTQLVALRRCLD